MILSAETSVLILFLLLFVLAVIIFRDRIQKISELIREKLDSKKDDKEKIKLIVDEKKMKSVFSDVKNFSIQERILLIQQLLGDNVEIVVGTDGEEIWINNISREESAKFSIDDLEHLKSTG